VEWDYRKKPRGCRPFRKKPDIVPCPEARCRFKNLQYPSLNAIEMCVIDTGSTYCALPSTVVEQLQPALKRIVTIQDIRGRSAEETGYFVDAELFDESSKERAPCGPILAIKFKATGPSILGRQLLNQFVMTLDGPMGKCRIDGT